MEKTKKNFKRKFGFKSLLLLLCTLLAVSGCASSADDGSVKPEKSSPSRRETQMPTPAQFFRGM